MSPSKFNYLEIGISASRIYGYNPEALPAGSTLYCIDPEFELGTRGLNKSVPIFPSSTSAFDALQNDPSDKNASGQYYLNLDFETRALDSKLRLSQLTGDGRRLSFADGCMHEVLMQNVRLLPSKPS